MPTKPTKRSERRSLRDEIIELQTNRPMSHLDKHGDEGSGHFDFGGHSDLHLDIHLDSPEVLARDAGVAVSLQLREAMETWMQLVSERLANIERRIDKLSGKK